MSAYKFAQFQHYFAQFSYNNQYVSKIKITQSLLDMIYTPQSLSLKVRTHIFYSLCSEMYSLHLKYL